MYTNGAAHGRQRTVPQHSLPHTERRQIREAGVVVVVVVADETLDSPTLWRGTHLQYMTLKHPPFCSETPRGMAISVSKCPDAFLS